MAGIMTELAGMWGGGPIGPSPPFLLARPSWDGARDSFLGGCGDTKPTL